MEEESIEPKIKLPDGRIIEDIEIFKTLGESNFYPELLGWK